MLSSLCSAAVVGVQAHPVEVEVYVGQGFAENNAVMVGLPDAAVRESRDRVKAALATSAYKYPDGKITINLAPADVKKEGPSFDLPIALGILQASGQEHFQSVDQWMMVGELGLNGTLRPVRGVLPMALTARDEKKRGVLVPAGNANEAVVVEGLEVYAIENLRQATDFLSGRKQLEPYKLRESESNPETDHELDFADVKGQESVKRALEIAVAGGHNLLMIGPPGSGKSMMAKRIPSIMPPMSLEEALETTKVHSVAGLLQAGQSLVKTRAFRSPHHTISDIGLIGGSQLLLPGEVSLAHNGVLFLDEMPEFKRTALEVLRQPLEDGKVTITRASGSITFPSRFMLVGAMNPTPTGSTSDVASGKISTAATQRYLNRISGPLLDRIDLHVEVHSVKHEQLMESRMGEASTSIRQRVIQAREFQHSRFQGKIWCNAQMTSKDLRQHLTLDEESKELLRFAMAELQLSGRAYDRILKVARTIADLAQSPNVETVHLSEAVSYRTLDRQLWG